MQFRHVLVAAQVALALVLLVTTGLFLRALQTNAGTDTGYDGRRVRVFSVNTSLAGHRDQQAAALVDRLLQRIERIDGVEAVAASRMIPLQAGRLGLSALRVPGYQRPRGNALFDADWDVVSPSFFPTLGVPLLAGRGFSSADGAGSGYVAIVNEAFATRAWPDREAIGQVIYQASRRDIFDRPLTIVGSRGCRRSGPVIGAGLYGLMAFYAVQRSREVAVRMALGATSAHVRGLMLRQAAGVAASGGAVGVLLSAGAAGAVRGLLVGVQPLDGAASSPRGARSAWCWWRLPGCRRIAWRRRIRRRPSGPSKLNRTCLRPK